MLTRKDIIGINQQFGNGKLHNSSSLDFVLSQTKRSPHWFRSMCLLTRALLIDHIFEDGNKRTAVAVIMMYLDMNNYDYNADTIAKIVLRLAKSNIKDVNTIGRLLNHAIE